MIQQLVILFVKFLGQVSRLVGRGAGATWPGEILLWFYPAIMTSIAESFNQGIILVLGTNGKTTTSSLIKHSLLKKNFSVVHNASGANLLNGIVSAWINGQTFPTKKYDWGVFEIDENSFPIVAQYLTQNSLKNKKLFVVLLNLFRDQLDRYGEVDVIYEKWKAAFSTLPYSHLFLNADDPNIASLGEGRDNITFFGLDEELGQRQAEFAQDSAFCLHCHERLEYKTYFLSHLGVWECTNCDNKRPNQVISTKISSHLIGAYNYYNTLAAFLVVTEIMDVSQKAFEELIDDFKPAFGRQEIILYNNKQVQLFLSKNPAGFNASLRAVLSSNPEVILLVLNDRIPDGRDVSWIWDVDFELISSQTSIIVSGDRVYDLALRISYSQKNVGDKKLIVEPDLETALKKGTDLLSETHTISVLPTYSAMLEVRKILTGRKIA